MRRASVLAALVTALLVGSVSAQQTAQRPTRELVQNGEPIVNRISPEDRTVVIRHSGSKEAVLGLVSPSTELVVLSQFEEVFVAHQLSVEPYLAENGSWIRTRVKARVTQVVNTRRLSLYSGGPVEFEIDSGQMMIKGIRVVAGLPPQITPRPHLIALQLDPVSKTWQLARGFAINPQNILEPIWHRGKSEPTDSRLYGKTLDEVVLGVAKGRRK